MGTSQSRDSKFDSSDEEEELEEEEEEEEEEEGFHSPKATPVRENPAARTELLNQRLQGLSLSKPEEAGPKVKLYQHVRSAGPNGRWVVVEKAATWSFDRVGDDEEDEDEDEEEEEGRKAGKRRAVKNWALVVGRRVRVPVSDRLPLQFHGEELRVDVAYKGVWAMRFPSPEEYRDFVTEYQNCLFENTHGLQATDANKIKVYGKDFIGWAKPEAADESIWEDAEDTFEPPARVRNFRETYTEATKGGGVQSLSIGAKEHSFLVGNSGVDVFRNMANGVKHTDTIKYQHGDPYSTPKKGMLIRGESNLMLWSPAKEGKPHASGVSQLDLETGRTVSEWKFEKDGTPIQMRDMTNDSKGAQLDPSASTFLGLDDNRLCRWDMRDRHGVVQDLASPVLNWSEGHQFSRGTNFQCFASTGDGAVAVGSRDGKVRLYGTTSMRQAKTAFPGLGLPITHIDVTYDGKWILATTDNYLMLISTVFIDKDGKQKTGFTGRMGSKIAAPRLLKVSALDTYLAGGTIKFHGGQFSFVTESGKQEHNLVASVGNHTLVWEFKTVKSDHHCYHKATSAERLKECFCYKVLPKNESVVDSKFMHESFASTSSPGAPLVVATPKIVHSFDW